MNRDNQGIRISDDMKKLVIARIKAMSDNLQLNIGSEQKKTYTKDELISNVSSCTDIGKKIILQQIAYIQAVSSGQIYQLIQNG